jgi:predicted permease
LLIGCGLMIRSAIELQRVDPGFDAKGVLTMRIGNLRARSDTEQVAKVASIEQRLRGLPGVSNVSVSATLPLENRPFNGRWGTREALGDPTKYRQAQFHVVSPTYFETMKTKWIAGHTFGPAENLPDTKAIVIDDRVAAMAFPNESPIGKTLLARISTPDAETYQVIGVIKHHRHTTLVGDEKESIFFANGAQGTGANAWILKTSGDPTALASSARAALLQLDPQLLITEMHPLSDLVDRAMAPTRFALALITAFAMLAGVLAAIGLYGVLSSLVRQRVPEIGVRLAFGAQPSSIFTLVLKQGLGLSAIGVGVGLVGALVLTRTMVNLLVNVQATDPLTFAAMIVVFFVIAAVACYLPARRAANVHPNVALREG